MNAAVIVVSVAPSVVLTHGSSTMIAGSEELLAFDEQAARAPHPAIMARAVRRGMPI